MASIEVAFTFEGGCSWKRVGSGLLECRSHALVDDDGGIWLVDPIDGDELEDLLPPGDVVGVIVLLDRHLRDSVRIARRHGARLLVPPGRWRRDRPRPADAESLAAQVDRCPFTFAPVIERAAQWLEWQLWWPGRSVLVVPEAVGTPRYYRTLASEPLGVHPLLRVIGPPRALLALDVEPELLLVGHGAPVERDVASALELAVHEARRELPAYLLATPRHAIRWARAVVGIGRASC
jgi:hypothetical protein